jgi:AraC-type DNA-binding domain-containing proteins
MCTLSDWRCFATCLSFPTGGVPALFLTGGVRDCRIVLGEQQLTLVRQLIECLWLTVHAKPFCRPAFDAQAAALMELYNDFHSQDMEQQEGTKHGTDIFNRFIQLVNGHARQEHKLAYYASRMCLTQRYLGSVVREVSGATAKDWIDRAIVTEAKMMLRHSDKPMSQVADELHFPSSSFFAKFFRRITGQTPAEYRDGKR